MQTIRFQKLPINGSSRVLDLGCGEGRHSLFAYHFSAASVVVGADLNYRDLETAKNRTSEFAPAVNEKFILYIQTDGLKLPFADHSFDVVICSEVLEHIKPYKSMLAEIERVLKPGGCFAMSVPRTWPETLCWWLSDSYHNVEGGHVRIFKANPLRKEITQQGFLYKGKHWAHSLHVPYWWLRCLVGDNPDRSSIVQWYHRFLVWDLMKKPKLTQILDYILNPFMGKSVVMYFDKKPQ